MPDRIRVSSLPARGAWIEIAVTDWQRQMVESLPARGAWIEIPQPLGLAVCIESLPARGAWIEIRGQGAFARVGPVAPRKGSVD